MKNPLDAIKTFWPIVVFLIGLVWSSATLTSDVTQLQEDGASTAEILALIEAEIRENREKGISRDHTIQQLQKQNEELLRLLLKKLEP